MSHSLFACDLFLRPLSNLIIFLTLTRLVVVINFENFSFALFTPPLGDFQQSGAHQTCPVNYSGLAVGDSRSWRALEAALPWRTGHCPVYTGQSGEL